MFGDRVVLDDCLVIHTRESEQNCGCDSRAILASGTVEQHPAVARSDGLEQESIGCAPVLQHALVDDGVAGKFARETNRRGVLFEHRCFNLADSPRCEVGGNISLFLHLRAEVDNGAHAGVSQGSDAGWCQPVETRTPHDRLARNRATFRAIAADMTHVVSDLDG